MVVLYSVIHGCFSSLPKLTKLLELKNVYTLIILLDSEEKINSFLDKSDRRSKYLV